MQVPLGGGSKREATWRIYHSYKARRESDLITELREAAPT